MKCNRLVEEFRKKIEGAENPVVFVGTFLNLFAPQEKTGMEEEISKLQDDLVKQNKTLLKQNDSLTSQKKQFEACKNYCHPGAFEWIPDEDHLVGISHLCRKFQLNVFPQPQIHICLPPSKKNQTLPFFAATNPEVFFDYDKIISKDYLSGIAERLQNQETAFEILPDLLFHVEFERLSMQSITLLVAAQKETLKKEIQSFHESLKQVLPDPFRILLYILSKFCNLGPLQELVTEPIRRDNYSLIIPQNDYILPNPRIDDEFQVLDNIPGTEGCITFIRKTELLMKQLDFLKGMSKLFSFLHAETSLLEWRERESKANFAIEREEIKTSQHLMNIVNIRNSIQSVEQPIDLLKVTKCLLEDEKAEFRQENDEVVVSAPKKNMSLGMGNSEKIFHIGAPGGETCLYLVGQLLKASKLISSFKDDEKLAYASVFPFLLCNIHPYQDGNGRTARVCLNYFMEQAVPDLKYLPVSVVIHKVRVLNYEYYAAYDEISEKCIKAMEGNYKLEQNASKIEVKFNSESLLWHLFAYLDTTKYAELSLKTIISAIFYVLLFCGIKHTLKQLENFEEFQKINEKEQKLKNYISDCLESKGLELLGKMGDNYDDFIPKIKMCKIPQKEKIIQGIESKKIEDLFVEFWNTQNI